MQTVAKLVEYVTHHHGQERRPLAWGGSELHTR